MRRPRSMLAGLALGVGLASVALGQAERPLAKFVPTEDLAAFVRFDGLDAHRPAWEKTAAHGILEDTTTGAMLRSLVRRLADVMTRQSPETPVDGEELDAILTHVTRRGMALGVLGRPHEEDVSVVLVFRGAAAGAVKEPFERFVRGAASGSATQILTRQDGRRLIVVRPGEGRGKGWVFWAEGDDLVIVTGRDEFGADPVIAALDGKAPSVADAPTLAELSKPEGGFDPVLVGWFEPSALPPTPPALGLDGLKRIDYRAGFEGEALVSITRMLAPAPRKGLLALLDQPAITAENFPPLPADLPGYTVASVDLAKTYDDAAALLKAMNPDGEAMLQGVEQQFRQTTGVGLRDQLLAQLGSRWAFYARPETIRASLTPFGAAADWLFHLPPAVMVVEVKDPEAFVGTLDSLVKTANSFLAQLGASEGGALRFEPLEPPAKGYRLVVPPQMFPLPTTINPGVALKGKYLAITTNLRGLRDSFEGGKSIAFPEGMPEGLVFLNVDDPRDLMPDLIANLPFLVQMMGRLGPRGPFAPPDPSQNPLATVAIDPKLVPDPDAIRARLFPNTMTMASDDSGLTIRTRESFPSINPVTASPTLAALVLPAISSAREAAQRSQSINNLKQIALAMHNYHSTYNEFPPAAICDKDGKPLLSWRVAILPYIEQQALYNQFHLDEPWDSPHNKPLADYVVAVYAPTRGDTPRTQTYYQLLVGKGAMYEPCEGTKIQDITDGTSNTIMAVEAAKAVPWTKPDDLTYDPDKPLPKFGGLDFAGGFNAAFADGSVRFLKFTIDEDTLRALITRAGGEVVSADAF